jgi:hypothetical protein
MFDARGRSSIRIFYTPHRGISTTDLFNTKRQPIMLLTMVMLEALVLLLLRRYSVLPMIMGQQKMRPVEVLLALKSDSVLTAIRIRCPFPGRHTNNTTNKLVATVSSSPDPKKQVHKQPSSPTPSTPCLPLSHLSFLIRMIPPYWPTQLIPNLWLWNVLVVPCCFLLLPAAPLTLATQSRYLQRHLL